MNQFYFVLSGLFFAAACCAQPVVNASDVTSNFSANFYFSEAEGFSPGNPGADQTWDFSNLDIAQLGQITALPVSGTPYESSYPTANYTTFYEGDFGSTWSYYKVDEQKYELISSIYPGVFATIYTQNPKTVVEFPMVFGSAFSDTYKSSETPQEITYSATYDAYGTLILPFGTYHNVIRQTTIDDGVVNYIWYNLHPFFPILQTSLEDNGLGILQYNGDLSDRDYTSSHFLIAPNPATSEIAVSLDARNLPATARLYDISGKQLQNSEITTVDSKMDVSQLSSGMYLLKIQDASGKESVRKMYKK